MHSLVQVLTGLYHSNASLVFPRYFSTSSLFFVAQIVDILSTTSSYLSSNSRSSSRLSSFVSSSPILHFKDSFSLNKVSRFGLTFCFLILIFLNDFCIKKFNRFSHLFADLFKSVQLSTQLFSSSSRSVHHHFQ